MQRKLKLEKEIKPLPKPNIVQKGVQGAKHAVSLTVSGAVHQQISKYEDENQTLKAAHGTEKVAESALRFASHKVKATNQKLKEKPYQKVSKLKFDTENAHKKLNQHKVALDHKTEQQTKKEAKKDAKKALKKAQQKQNQKNAAKTAKKGATTAGKKAGEAAMDVSKTIVKFVANNKVVVIILIIFLLLFGLVLSLGSSLFTSLADTGTMVIASSYTSEDEDIYAANDYMNSLENNLNDQINNIPNVYVGWNEYNYYIDPIQHDPYELISYLTAMKIDFEYDAEIQGLIQEIFNALYTLEVESIHEVRSYQYIDYDEEGNEVIVTVYYDYYKLAEKRYDKLNLNIHDHFFAKSLDKVRAGGVVAFVTSKGTLDKANPQFRKYLAQRAELLGAIRLPNNAFKDNAGTEVTSDIIFLQKRDKMLDIEPDWVHLGQTEDGVLVNKYFEQHPEMILGEMKQGVEFSMYHLSVLNVRIRFPLF